MLTNTASFTLFARAFVFLPVFTLGSV
jgi:hypothetical protein